MKFSQIAMVATICFAALFSVSSVSHAQLALEKAFVAKSKLSNPIWKKHDPNSNAEVDHAAWDAFLGKYVSTSGNAINLVAYSRVSSADKQALKRYLEELQVTDVTTLNRNEQYAFWMNLYNASMVNLILDKFPIKSVFDIKKSLLDVKGPFNDPVAQVLGKTLTLDDIESGIVRPIWNDPLLHYGFNCAAIGCPNLGKKAFRGATVRSQLASAAGSYINNPRGVRVEGNKVIASKIFGWYADDFGNSEAAVLNHIRQYAGGGLKAKLAGKKKINAYEYDWALNGR